MSDENKIAFDVLRRFCVRGHYVLLSLYWHTTWQHAFWGPTIRSRGPKLN